MGPSLGYELWLWPLWGHQPAANADESQRGLEDRPRRETERGEIGRWAFGPREGGQTWGRGAPAVRGVREHRAGAPGRGAEQPPAWGPPCGGEGQEPSGRRLCDLTSTFWVFHGGSCASVARSGEHLNRDSEFPVILQCCRTLDLVPMAPVRYTGPLFPFYGRRCANTQAFPGHTAPHD